MTSLEHEEHFSRVFFKKGFIETFMESVTFHMDISFRLKLQYSSVINFLRLLVKGSSTFEYLKIQTQHRILYCRQNKKILINLCGDNSNLETELYRFQPSILITLVEIIN